MIRLRVLCYSLLLGALCLLVMPNMAVAQDSAACIECHSDKKIYQQSVHKDLMCNNCHQGYVEFPHPERAPNQPPRWNPPMICGSCHEAELEQYRRSVHGTAYAEGKAGVPTCTDCHGVHSIEHPGDAAKSNPANALGRSSCSRCHASEVLSREYALPLDRVRTYMDSYHGLASQRGAQFVANCASCHGVHEILASADPKSSVNPANLPQTCGKCHVGATANFARGDVHRPAGRGQLALHVVTTFYIVLIVVVIGAMVIHNAFDFRMKLRGVSSAHAEGFFKRSEVVEHAILLVSFVILALSGFALKWPGGIFGSLLPVSEHVRRLIHRTSGAVMLALFAYHLIQLAVTRRGHEFLGAFRPRVRDVTSGIRNALFMAGIRRRQPVLGYPSYIEKVEYWALIWGTIIMGLTGLLLWFMDFTLRILPLWVVNLLTTIHYYEALLATLAILVWHIYFVVLDPTIYPLKSAGRTKPVRT